MDTVRTKKDLRRHVASRLGRQEIPDPLWEEWADEVEVICQATDEDREERIENLISNIERDLRVFAEVRGWEEGRPIAGGQGGSSLRLQSTADEAAVDLLSDYERDRACAFSEILAEQAALWPAVHSFRHAAFGGGTISPTAAREFVRSPIAAILTLNRLPQDGTPSSAISAQVEYLPKHEAGGDEERVVVVIDPSGERFTRSRRRGRTLSTLPLPPGEGEAVPYWPGSLLAKLYDLARRLSQHFPWDEAQAAWFVMTGTTPEVAPLCGVVTIQRAGVSGGNWQRALITLRVEPWVPASRVESLFSRIQRRVLPLPLRSNERGLKAWLFVRDVERTESRHIGLTEGRARWNEAHPEQQFATLSGWRRAYRRGEAHVRYIRLPRYRRLRDVGSTAVQTSMDVNSPWKVVDDRGHRTEG